MKPVLVKHKNQWVIKDFYLCSDKPEVIIHHWPIGTISPPFALHLHENQEVEKSGQQYALRVAPYQWSYISLADAGRTKSIDTYVKPYPCPKVRKGIETRYHYGQWQKLLKSGWVSA